MKPHSLMDWFVYYLGIYKEQQAIRERLVAQGEPCGGFLHQCSNRAAHLEYAALPDEQKRLMMEEREVRIKSRSA